MAGPHIFEAGKHSYYQDGRQGFHRLNTDASAGVAELFSSLWILETFLHTWQDCVGDGAGT